MGKSFGELGVVVRGIIYYKLSPYEQKAFAGAITHGLPNMVPRTMQTVVTWLPPFILTWLTYVSVEEAYKQSKRKNLKDYENEVEPPPPEPVAETHSSSSSSSDSKRCKPKKEKE